MKKLSRIILIMLVLGVGLGSCELSELEFENPNQVTPDRANVNDLYNSVQLELNEFFVDYFFEAASTTRMVAATGAFDYFNSISPQGLNNGWNTAYAEFLPDARAVVDLAEERGLPIHAGSAKVMEAYALTLLVDMFGNVPYTEALQGTDVISPSADDGASIYAAADALLDEAITLLENAAGAAAPTNDFFYDGDPAKWATLAKTLKLRNAVTTRLTNGNAAATIDALVSEGDLIDGASEDFAFQYGNNQLNPNSRHFMYNNSYNASDGNYMSNYYMWLLKAEKVDADDNTIVDPRIRFYFYRQTFNSADSDQNNYSCHLSIFPDPEFKPARWDAVDPALPYCIASDDGYWGRDHLNNQGIPPDGFLRTVYGLYPGGGKFDDNSFSRTQNNGTDGALGEGINPFLLASYVDFMRAEAALTVGTSDDPRALLESGIRKSMDKVIGFASKVNLNNVVGTNPTTGEDITAEQAFLPDAADVQAYVDYVLAEYDAAADDDSRLNVVMKEYYIALWGNGMEAYNMYRRTGMPNNMQPALEEPGPFIRTHFYPADHVNLNSNATQKELTLPVFWDDGSADVY